MKRESFLIEIYLFQPNANFDSFSTGLQLLFNLQQLTLSDISYQNIRPLCGLHSSTCGGLGQNVSQTVRWYPISHSLSWLVLNISGWGNFLQSIVSNEYISLQNIFRKYVSYLQAFSYHFTGSNYLFPSKISMLLSLLDKKM